jgi:hypothetical protein
MHIRLLQGLLVKCLSCNQSLHLSEMMSHICDACTSQSLASHEITATTILSQPSSAPPSAIEKKLASTIVKRMMHDGAIQIPTGGQPLTLVHIPTPRVNSEESSKKTLKTRSNEIALFRKRISGAGSLAESVQRQDELKQMSREEREDLLKSLEINTSVSSEQILALKANL